PEAATTGVNQLTESQGHIWAGTSQGLYLRDADSWRLATDNPALGTSPITMLFNDSDQNLWVGTIAGLARIRGGKLVEYLPETSPGAFKGVISAFEDHEHSLWLGSQWEGIARVWNGWTRRYSANEGLLEPIIWSLSRAPDGRVWVGHNDGVGVLDKGVYQAVLRGDQLPHPNAYNMLAEADRIWIGTRRGLVILRDGKIEAPSVFAPMASAQINGIVRGQNDVIWFPTTEGLFRLKDGKLRHYGQDDGMATERIRLVRELRDGRLLAGTQNGLYELKGERLVPLGLDQGLRPELDITAIDELANGDLVIGTLGEEVFLFNGHRWQVFGRTEGLPANAPFFITEDTGWLWVTGIRGISRMPIAQMRELMQGKRKTVDAEMVLNERGDRRSGQQGYCCNGAGNSKGFIKDHVLWLPTRDGVVTLNTRTIVKNPKPPTVVIERIQIAGKWQDVSTEKDLELPAKVRDLGFEFTALSFQEPASVQLRYRLRGYDQDWRDLELVTPRAANYTNLPAGNYTFEVMASNNANVWNTSPTELSFHIQPYFYETRLFYVLMTLLFGILMYLVWRQQQRAHGAQRALLEQQVLERTQQLHAANLQLEHASQTDPLTGLRNRRYLASQLPADLSFYDREHTRLGGVRQSLLFALVDIDHFKRVNDTYGHGAGDRVLQQFAEVLTRLVRTGDYIVRWGGEEF
ncbi:MAG: diguanylate cyclase, partial [Arenimonas sp.]